MKKLGLMCLITLASILVGYAAETTDQQPAKTQVKHVNAKEAAKLISEQKVTVLDVRTADEFQEGHIAGATNINFLSSSFATNVSKLPKTNTYLVHCATGVRSTSCLKILDRQHFGSVYHLDGGFEAWKKAGLPVEK